MRKNLLAPSIAVKGLKFLEFIFAEIEPRPVDVFVTRHPADGGFFGHAMACGAVHDPLQDAHVVAEAWPQELALFVFAEPVHVEDARTLAETTLHGDPVAEVVAHVVAAERQHGHGVTAHFADGARSGSRHLTAHGGACIDAADPVEGLINERHRGGPTPPKDDGRNGHAFWLFPIGIDRGALGGWRGEARVWMGGHGARFLREFRRPLIALPVGAFGGWCFRHAFPPDAAVRRERDIGKDGVFPQRGHRVGIGLVAGARGDAEEASFRIDRVEPTVRPWLQPGDVIAHGPDFPALLLEMLRRDEHGKVRLATGARESRRHVGLFALRILDTQDEHVLRQPTFITSHGGSDAQGKALLAEQRIATVATAIAPDLTRLGEVNDVLLLVAGPSHILLPFLQRCSHGVHAGDDALFAFVDDLEDRLPDAGHNTHVHHRVGGIRDLNTDLRDGRIERPHAVGQHIHRAPFHAAIEETAELLLHRIRVHPVVGGARSIFGIRADEGALLDARDIAGIRLGVIAARPLLLIQFDEGATRHHLLAQAIVFGLGAVHPVDAVRLAKGGHFFHPLDQVRILCGRL